MEIVFNQDRNNIVFKTDECNSSFILELANQIAHETMTYKKCTNFSICEKVTGSNLLDAGRSYNKKDWIPRDWMKYDKDGSKFIANQMMAISYECKDIIQVHYKK